MSTDKLINKLMTNPHEAAATELSNDTYGVLKQVRESGSVIITSNRKPMYVIMTIDEFNKLN